MTIQKTVTFIRKSMPDKPDFGWADCVSIIDRENNECYTGAASTCPNPYRMENNHAIPWQRLYALIAPGQWEFECVVHEKFGKCLLINNGQPLPTENKNYNHNGEKIATEIFVHAGALNSANKKWRGSRGCFTIPPDDVERFFAMFCEGEGGVLILKNK